MAAGEDSRVDRPTRNVVVRELVGDVVAEVASDELPVFESLGGLDDATVVRRLARRRRGDPLGFGPSEIALVVMPVVWIAVDEAARQAASLAVDGTVGRIRTVLRKIFRRRRTPVELPPLTAEQLTRLRERILRAATDQGLSERRAEDIANAVIARLVTQPTEPTQPIERNGPTERSEPIERTERTEPIEEGEA